MIDSLELPLGASVPQPGLGLPTGPPLDASLEPASVVPELVLESEVGEVVALVSASLGSP